MGGWGGKDVPALSGEHGSHPPAPRAPWRCLSLAGGGQSPGWETPVQPEGAGAREVSGQGGVSQDWVHPQVSWSHGNLWGFTGVSLPALCGDSDPLLWVPWQKQL